MDLQTLSHNVRLIIRFEMKGLIPNFDFAKGTIQLYCVGQLPGAAEDALFLLSWHSRVILNRCLFCRVSRLKFVITLERSIGQA